MAPRKDHSSPAYHLCLLLLLLLLLLSTATLSGAGSTSYSALCASPSPALDRHTDNDDTLSLLRSFHLSDGYFSGGGDGGGLFSGGDDRFSPRRSFSFVPHGVSRTADEALVHLTATLYLSGPRSSTHVSRRIHRHNYTSTHSIAFSLDGYYSSVSNELCMVGSGAELDADGSIKQLVDVALRLRVPRPSRLADPFVTGRLEGAGFEAVSLVAYDESDGYVYGGEKPFCPPPPPTSGDAARGALQALEGRFSCAALKKLLRRTYRLEQGGGCAPALAPTSFSGSRPPLLALRMHIDQIHCTKSGSVRALMELSNDTEVSRYGRHAMAAEEAVVAEGYWNAGAGQLCLRACRVARSAADAEVRECGIRMSFWFLSAWTIRDRGVVAGMLWDAAQVTVTPGKHAGEISGVTPFSGIEEHGGNHSRMSYKYTMVEDAKKQYLKLKAELSSTNGKKKKSSKDAFPAANNTYSYRDFEFHFFDKVAGSGEAYPMTIGSAMVYGDWLAADSSSSSQRQVAGGAKDKLLNVSYDIRHHVPPEGWVRPNNMSYSVTLHEQRISAEGVYDPSRGILCMIGCRDRNGSTDCQMLVTVQLAAMDSKAQGHGKGVISSLRDEADPLFFEKADIELYGMYSEQVQEAISRMDLESVMVVVSATLSCAFTALQILHTKRDPEAPAATSITMLAILALGHVAPLVLNAEALFMSRRKQYVPFSGDGSLELNEVMMRAPTLLALVLQLRLLQLAWSGRRKAHQSKAETLAAGERRALLVCLPLYLIGGALAGIAHAVNARRGSAVAARVAPAPATLWGDLAAYAGLVLDGFLLPQVALNAFSGSTVRAISPWFYAGVTVIRSAPHAYDALRARGYAPSLRPSYVYASPRDDLFGGAWDVVVPCAAALLAALLFLQQRLGDRSFAVRPRARRSGAYEMVSGI